MTSDEAQQSWSRYSGKNYVYSNGKFKNNVVKAKSFELRAGNMFIEMSDGQLIKHEDFNNVLKQTDRQVQSSEDGVSFNDAYNIGGETVAKPQDVHEHIPISQRYKIDDLDTDNQQVHPYVNGIPKHQIERHPIHSILEKAPKTVTAIIPIEIKIEIVQDEAIKLLEMTFPDEAFKETISFYKGRIDISIIKSSIESSLAKYLAPKFSNIKEDDLDEYEDGVEGTLIN